jgi:hypothetical protein
VHQPTTAQGKKTVITQTIKDKPQKCIYTFKNQSAQKLLQWKEITHGPSSALTYLSRSGSNSAKTNWKPKLLCLNSSVRLSSGSRLGLAVQLDGSKLWYGLKPWFKSLCSMVRLGLT